MIDGAGAQGPLEALDFFILQKILPRLHGSRRNLEPILNALEAFTKNPNSLDSSDAEHLDPILARSHSRIRRFKQILSANQFASFTD
jgi:5-methylcytosine-specific restriction protein B